MYPRTDYYVTVPVVMAVQVIIDNSCLFLSQPHDDCSAVNTSTFSVGVFAPSRLHAHSSVSQPPTQTSMSQGEGGAAASSSVSLVSSLYSGCHRLGESFVGSAYWNEIGGSRSSQLSVGRLVVLFGCCIDGRSVDVVS